tara:strand:+ start:5295 stop:6395 length:1101 start_codon:yes stop_codon:yes gene_type:complete
MANELESSNNEEIEAVAEEQVELDEFKASGENSAIADPVVKGSNKRPADKTPGFTAPAPGGANEKSGSESKGEDLISSKSGKKAPARKADKAAGEGKVEGGTGSASSVTPGQGGSNEMAPGHKGGVKEDIDAIFGEDLDEELREKAETVFEAAVNARLSEMNAEYSDAFDSQLAEAKEQIAEDMTAKVDEYINYLSEQWMEENQVAIESSLKVEVAESFMSGLKGLMEAHNVVIPEEADSDILTDLQNRIEELEGKLEEETSSKIQLGSDLVEAQVQNIFAEASDGLAETQIEKLRALSEGLDYDNVEDFEKKLNTLKESYFDNKAAGASADVEDQDPVELDEETQPKLTGSIANYADAISRTVRK